MNDACQKPPYRQIAPWLAPVSQQATKVTLAKLFIAERPSQDGGEQKSRADPGKAFEPVFRPGPALVRISKARFSDRPIPADPIVL
jgi:hypothetical protein